MKTLLNKIKPIIDKIKPITGKIVYHYKKIADIATPTAVLVIICLVITLALSGTNLLTKDKIAALELQNKNDAMAKLIPADEYHELNATTSFGDVIYNVAIKDGDTIGCIFTVASKGYGGDIKVMTAVNMDGTIAAIEILDASGETPGLGQNVTKPAWFSQFSGLSENITVVKGGTANKDNNEINAVTGATISSTGVKNAVNQALEYAKEILVINGEVKDGL